VAIVRKAGIRGGLWVAIGFLTVGPLWAAELHDLVGTWIVESVSPAGMIPVTVEFTGTGDTLSGQWTVLSNWTEANKETVTDIELRGTSLSFKVGGWEDKAFWSGQFNQKDRIKMDLIDAVDGHVWQARTLRRASLPELARIKSDAPTNLITHKIPLPVLHDLPFNGLAITPPMGWNSWNHFKEAVDDEAIRRMADALVSSGLRDAGYVYINIDDGWQGRRDERGLLRPNSKFPDMKALADYVHAKGLKLGLYNSPGPVTCSGYVGSHGYEDEDAKALAEWGIDYFKYDWCSAGSLYSTQPEMQALYQKMGAALQATGRPIVFSLCQYGLFDVGSWGRKVGGNLWRTGNDSIEARRWAAISARFESDGKPEDSGPGGWNDPDMMLIGNGGLNVDEIRTHMALWSMLAAPLIIGNDLRTMTTDEKSALMNPEIIAVDQDALGRQGRRILKHGKSEIWTKPLKDGGTAVAVFNRADTKSTVEANWSALGLADKENARDLWRHRDLGTIIGAYKVVVPAHGTALLKVVPEAGVEPAQP
jgi:alpha-galactosidase